MQHTSHIGFQAYNIYTSAIRWHRIAFKLWANLGRARNLATSIKTVCNTRYSNIKLGAIVRGYVISLLSVDYAHLKFNFGNYFHDFHKMYKK